MRRIIAAGILSLAIAAAVTLATLGSSARGGSGSIVVTLASKGRAVLAADSRMIFTDGSAPNDETCKIQKLGDGFLFAAVGRPLIVDPVRQWEAYDVARLAYKKAQEKRDLQAPPGTFTEEVAEKWAAEAMMLLKKGSATPSFEALTRGKGEMGIVVTGIFVHAENNRIFLCFRPIRRLNPSSVYDPQFAYVQAYVRLDEHMWPAAFGKDEVVEKIKKPDEAKWHNVATRLARELARRPPAQRDIFKAKRLAELTLQLHPDKNTLGGEIDVVELGGSGKITWHALKKSCRAVSR